MDKLNALIEEHKPGFTLPQAFYTDEEIYQLDLEKIWHRNWLFAGHVSGVMNTLTYPFFFFEAASDVCVTFSVTPKSPTLSVVDAHWYVDKNAEEGKDYRVERVIGAWKATGDQDWILTENNQKGVSSIAYEPGPYSESQEGLCKIFLEWYLDQISVSP